MTSEAARRRESKRQQFIESALINMDALIQEIHNKPSFLTAEQAGRLRTIQAQMNDLPWM